jgi:hypothetical protein
MNLTKTVRCITLLVAGFGVAALGGCGFLNEQHPTTESRYMTHTEQEYWSDRQMRVDKAAEWDKEIARQSKVRMSQSMDPRNW